MTPERQRIAIAQVMLGEHLCGCGQHWRQSDKKSCGNAVPDYLSDLNAMHEAEKTLTIQSNARYELELCAAVDASGRDSDIWHYVLTATAAQRAEAFLKTIGKWEP